MLFARRDKNKLRFLLNNNCFSAAATEVVIGLFFEWNGQENPVAFSFLEN